MMSTHLEALAAAFELGRILSSSGKGALSWASRRKRQVKKGKKKDDTKVACHKAEGRE